MNCKRLNANNELFEVDESLMVYRHNLFTLHNGKK